MGGLCRRWSRLSPTWHRKSSLLWHCIAIVWQCIVKLYNVQRRYTHSTLGGIRTHNFARGKGALYPLSYEGAYMALDLYSGAFFYSSTNGRIVQWVARILSLRNHKSHLHHKSQG